MKTLFVFLVTVALVVGGLVWYSGAADPPQVAYRTVQVERGDLRATISATGIMQPEELIDVGAQVAGKISHLGRDPQDSSKSIDYGSRVEKGTVLAQIDDAVYRAQVDQATADLERSKADLQQLQAKLVQAERGWKRAQPLAARKTISEAEVDLARANVEIAKSALAVGRADIEQRTAALKLAQIQLGYTTIKSPVDGVIIDRRVNVGQTVVASLNAPSLFLIAKDLRRLQVWASVNEADIGRIFAGQAVSFTVDAFPGEVFHGEVVQIRLNATNTQNVVTYTVVVSTDNTDGKLLPYLTANLQFELDQRSNVLLLPNSALRWRPASASGEDASKDGTGNQASSGRREEAGTDRSQVWIERQGRLQPLEVEVGLNDGIMTEVSGEGIAEGLQVVIGEIPVEADETTNNPFAPKITRGKKTAD